MVGFYTELFSEIPFKDSLNTPNPIWITLISRGRAALGPFSLMHTPLTRA